MLESTSMSCKVYEMTLKAGLFFTLLAAVACAPEKTPEPAATAGPVAVGTLTVDAEISKGTRFTVYANDQWTAPKTQHVLEGQRAQYTFPLPTTVRSLRFDPGEKPDTHAAIYSIVIALPGLPKKSLPLTDLTSFLKYHCDIKANPNLADVTATGPEMYFMSIVNPATYPVVQ